MMSGKLSSQSLKFFARRHFISIEKYITYETHLDRKIPEIKTGIPTHILLGTSDDIQKLPLSLKKRIEFNDRIDRNHKLFVARGDKGEFLGYGWIAFESVYLSEIGRNISLPENEAWFYDAYVSPEYRHYKIHQKLDIARLNFLKEKRVVKAGRNVEKKYPSSKFENLGWKRAKEVLSIKIFNKCIFSKIKNFAINS